MNISDKFSTYFSAFKLDSGLSSKNEVEKYIKEKPQRFSYGHVTYPDYDAEYKSGGYVQRKMIAIPSALIAGIVKLIYHFAIGIFVGIPKACCGENKYLKVAAYRMVRDLEEALGWIITLFNDKRGTYLVQESLFQKECYSYFEKIANEVQSTAKIETKIWTNSDRLKIYEETMGFIRRGHYVSPENRRFDLKSGEDLYECSNLINITGNTNDIQLRYPNGQVFVAKQDCLEAAEEQVKKGHKVAVVNFGSHDNPGGNSDRGTNGQEEDLCYRSELAGFMEDQRLGFSLPREVQFYPLEGLEEREDHLIHTPDVLVFRASRENSYALLSEPFRVGILTTAALINPELSGKEVVDYAIEDEKLQVRNLIITQLYAAYVQEYDTVILGAFGCGYYKNPSQAVAKIYKEVIDNFFKGAFQQIVFAILDDPLSKGSHNPAGNFKPFEEAFND